MSRFIIFDSTFDSKYLLHADKNTLEADIFREGFLWDSHVIGVKFTSHHLTGTEQEKGSKEASLGQTVHIQTVHF